MVDATCLPSASATAADKLAAARTRLILDQPFLGALVLRLPLQSATWCRTMATDARTLYYNPLWIDSLSTGQAQFALAHEALHCALGHFARRGQRVRHKWDLACDFAINPLLLDAGLPPPPAAQVLDLYRGLTAEEIYPCIEDDLDTETLDEHAWDASEGGQGGDNAPDKVGAGGTAGNDPDGPPQPLTAAERERLQPQWQRHLAAAAQRAQEAGKLSGQWARLCDAGLAAQVSWRALLAQYLTQAARDDYTWQRPSRRAGGSGEALWPALRSHCGNIHVAIDVSGSVTAADLAGFLGELDALKGMLPARIALYACDSALAEGAPWVFEPWEALHLPQQFVGGGGTAFAPVFAAIERAGQRPDALVYFTDAQGEFPACAPDYPVLWLVKGKAPVPWGRRIQLN